MVTAVGVEAGKDVLEAPANDGQRLLETLEVVGEPEVAVVEEEVELGQDVAEEGQEDVDSLCVLAEMVAVAVAVETETWG